MLLNLIASSSHPHPLPFQHPTVKPQLHTNATWSPMCPCVHFSHVNLQRAAKALKGMDPALSCDVLVARHGETDWNK